jgi:hypothetical protein
MHATNLSCSLSSGNPATSNNQGIWKLKSFVLLAAVLLLLSGPALAESPMSVQAALDYQVPENSCSKPKIIANEAVVAAPLQDPTSVSFFEGSSTANMSDVPGYTLERQARKEKRWRKCLAGYKEGLLDDMGRLKGSAQHGLTQAQANAIVANMALIQRVYMTPDGVLEEAELAANSASLENQ